VLPLHPIVDPLEMAFDPLAGHELRQYRNSDRRACDHGVAGNSPSTLGLTRMRPTPTAPAGRV
jgi:hypothetical protein